MSETLFLAFAGIALGLIGSFALTRYMQGQLFGISATDPLTYILIVIIYLVVATLAGVIPTRRALKVDPLTTLRNE